MDVLFFYGIGATHLQMFEYEQTNRFPNGTHWYSVKFPEERQPGWFGAIVRYVIWFLASLPWHRLGLPRMYPPREASQMPLLWQANIAGSQDQFEVAKMVHQHANKFPDRPYVIYGVSRGALAVFRALSRMSPVRKPALIILEGCPDSIANVARARYGPFWGQVATRFLRWVTKYDPAADLDPERFAVPEWAADVPFITVTSNADVHVPQENSWRVMDHLLGSHRWKYFTVLKLDELSHKELSGVTDRPTEIAEHLKQYQDFVRKVLEEHVLPIRQ
jgi:hypothetical protein